MATLDSGWDVKVYTKYSNNDFLGHFTLARDGLHIDGSIMREDGKYKVYWPFNDRNRMVAGPTRETKSEWEQAIFDEYEWRINGGMYNNGLH